MDTDTFRSRVQGRDLGSAQTVDHYITWIERFHDWHGGEITEGILRDFDSALDDGDVTWASPPGGYAFQTRVKALSAVAKWGEVMEDAVIRPDVTDLVRGGPGEFNPTVLSRESVQSVLDQDCDLTGCEAARTLGYDAIMRAIEIARVKPEDVDVEAGTIYVRAAKNSLRRTIGIDRETASLLADQIERVHAEFENPSKVFYNSYWNGLKANTWSQHFRRHHHEAGFHAFGRHTATVHYMEEHGFGDTYVRARHRRPATTSRYVSIADVDQPDWV